MPGSARCRALPAACHTLLLLPRSLHRVHSTPSRPGVCFVQRRTCALVAHLDTFLRSRSTQQEAAARYSTPPAAAASADAPRRVSASDVERLRGLPPAEWEAAASVVVREAQAKGVVASSFLKGVLETCPTYATAAAFAKRAGIGFVAASAQLAKVALAAGDRNGCEAVYRALLLDPAHSTTYHAGGQLDAICRELKRHGEHETLLAVLSLRQASRRQGTRVSGDTLCLAVEIATSYAQLHATLAKGHRWRARSGLLAQAVAEAGIRLAEPRVVDLALWVLEGDYGDPSAPFFYEDPAASQQETAAAVEPPTNEAAADAILADIEAATRARKKRVVAWSGAWGALLHLHAVLDDEKQALAVWKRIDDAGMSLDIACRRHLLHAAGHFLRSGAQEGSKEGQRSSKRGQWMHVVRAAKEGVSEHKRLMRLANSVASGKYKRPSETVKGPQRTAQRKVAASVDALSAIE
eukprot:Rhum_TRINITY_DN14534_c4_g4::Rhum_TRINITY_DN14534_c4_g4_i1::g.95595::m.95595